MKKKIEIILKTTCAGLLLTASQWGMQTEKACFMSRMSKVISQV